MMKKVVNYTMLLLVFVSVWSCKQEIYDLSVADIFTDNMVLQQKAKVPIWGTTKAHKEVRVTFGKQTVSANADEKGKWLVYLNDLKLGSPDSLIIESGINRKVFKNVLVGEVWLCSGQSNMEMNLGCTWATVKDSENEVAQANYPNIRLLVVNRNISFQPVDTFHSIGWQVCTPETAANFSAVGYFFGREIHQTQNVPVGLIQAAWGGTVAEAWTTSEKLQLMSEFAPVIDQMKQKPVNQDSLQAQYERELKAWNLEINKVDAGMKNGDTLFAKFDLPTNNWTKIKIPGMWEQTEIGIIDGVVWFRMSVNVPKEQLGKDLTLNIAPPDDADETFFNGTKVGESKEWKIVRTYKIPKNLVREGKNIVAVRLFDFQGDGGFMGEKTDFALSSEDGWKLNFGNDAVCKIGFELSQVPALPAKPENPNQPTVLFNGMLHPIIPFAIRGAIWYQGESNAARAFQYQTLFPLMISAWREKWQQGDFPFLFVQLANYMKRNVMPVEDAWAELREAQSMALKLPNTGMAVTIDIGDGNDIHPANKQDVGKRLAGLARNKVYGENYSYFSPLFKNMKIENEKITIEFENIYEGLKTSDNAEIKGFAIAGEDKKFVWAKAEIKENRVEIWSPKVKNPVAVRYAWSSNPECNLFNSIGLPVSPFRTDTWKGITQK